MLRMLVDHYQRLAARRMFTRWTPLYETEVTENAYSAAEAVARETLAAFASRPLASEKPRIADIGIGTGLLSQKLYDSLPCTITGLDFTPDMLSICAAREIADLLVQCDVGKDHWPIPPSSQDAVISAGLLEYLTPSMLQHYLQQTYQTLKPAGCSIFTYVPTEDGIRKTSDTRLWRGHSGTYLVNRYSPNYLEDLLQKNNLKLHKHTDEFTGCSYMDGSSYPYRLIVAEKVVA